MCAVRRSATEWTFFAVAAIGGILTFLQMWLVPETVNLPNENENSETSTPMILWWAASFAEDEKYRNCGDKRCFFTNNRSNSMHPLLRAIIFYGSNFEINDVPIPRAKNVRWALLHEESPRNRPIFVHQAALELFNYSATFSRYSDIPLTLQALPGEQELVDTNYYLSVGEKNELISTKKLAPVLYIQTDCDTASDRDSYVAELMKYIQVDSYGACLNNRQLPKSLKENYIGQLDSEELFRFAAQYKFTLAFENAVCDDYITEKLWRPLIVGSVPVYYGSPTFKDWLPHNRSAIDVRNFEHPRDLAEFLLKLNDDDFRYEEHLEHKLSNPETSIKNDRLLNALRSRPKNIHSIFGYSLRAFECFVCEKLHDAKSFSKMSTKQYNCPLPKKILPDSRNKINPWAYQWKLDKCAAKLLSQHVSNGTKIDIDSFTEKIFLMNEKNDC